MNEVIIEEGEFTCVLLVIKSIVAFSLNPKAKTRPIINKIGIINFEFT